MRLDDLAISVSDNVSAAILGTASGIAKGLAGSLYGTFGKTAKFELTERVKDEATKERFISLC